MKKGVFSIANPMLKKDIILYNKFEKFIKDILEAIQKSETTIDFSVKPPLELIDNVIQFKQNNIISPIKLDTNGRLILDSSGIKTINGESIIGSGNISVPTSFKTINSSPITGEGDISIPTTFKSINSESLIGSGNIVIPTTFKTINSESLIGEGNISIPTTFKTINSESLVGNGDIVIPTTFKTINNNTIVGSGNIDILQIESISSLPADAVQMYYSPSEGKAYYQVSAPVQKQDPNVSFDWGFAEYPSETVGTNVKNGEDYGDVGHRGNFNVILKNFNFNGYDGTPIAYLKQYEAPEEFTWGLDGDEPIDDSTIDLEDSSITVESLMQNINFDYTTTINTESGASTTIGESSGDGNNYIFVVFPETANYNKKIIRFTFYAD